MKKIALFLVLIFGAWGSLWAATLVGTPSINFGTATYTSDNSGASLIKVTLKKNPSQVRSVATSGSGHIKNWQNDYNIVPIQFTGMDTNNKMYLYLESNSYTITTAGCGSITLDYLVFDNNGEEINYAIKDASTLKKAENGVYIGGQMSITSFQGTNTCTISGSIPFGYLESRYQGYDYITAYMDVSLTLRTPFSLTHDNGAALDFGTLCRSSQSQTITITPSGTVGSSSVVCPVSANISADSFTVDSSSATNFSVTLPNTINLTSGGNNLQVTNVTSSCSSGCSVGAGGSVSFGVGGTLTVPANSPVGEYTGTYQVTVTY